MKVVNMNNTTGIVFDNTKETEVFTKLSNEDRLIDSLHLNATLGDANTQSIIDNMTKSDVSYAMLNGSFLSWTKDGNLRTPLLGRMSDEYKKVNFNAANLDHEIKNLNLKTYRYYIDALDSSSNKENTALANKRGAIVRSAMALSDAEAKIPTSELYKVTDKINLSADVNSAKANMRTYTFEELADSDYFSKDKSFIEKLNQFKEYASEAAAIFVSTDRYGTVEKMQSIDEYSNPPVDKGIDYKHGYCWINEEREFDNAYLFDNKDLSHDERGLTSSSDYLNIYISEKDINLILHELKQHNEPVPPAVMSFNPITHDIELLYTKERNKISAKDTLEHIWGPSVTGDNFYSKSPDGLKNKDYDFCLDELSRAATYIAAKEMCLENRELMDSIDLHKLSQGYSLDFSIKIEEKEKVPEYETLMMASMRAKNDIQNDIAEKERIIAAEMAARKAKREAEAAKKKAEREAERKRKAEEKKLSKSSSKKEDRIDDKPVLKNEDFDNEYGSVNDTNVSFIEDINDNNIPDFALQEANRYREEEIER